MKVHNILATIGGTPHIRINRLFGDAQVWVKSERSNPGGSIKDRIALAMVEDAERSGALPDIGRKGGLFPLAAAWRDLFVAELLYVSEKLFFFVVEVELHEVFASSLKRARVSSCPFNDTPVAA